MRFFKERRVPFQFVDLDQEAPAPRELDVFVRAVGSDALVDTDSACYARRGLAWIEFDPIQEILADASLLRTPVVRDGNAVVVGGDPEGWRRLASGER